MDAAFSRNGPAFKQLALSWGANVLGDTLVAVGLANTLFFDLPSGEARDKVALYLLLTIAPFAVVAPVLGGIFGRFPGATRGMLVISSTLRVFVALAMIVVGLDTLWLFPFAFGMLVLSRLFGISKSALLPVALPQPVALVAANSQLARIGIYAGFVAVAVGGSASWISSDITLALAAVAFVVSAFFGLGLPDPRAAGRKAEEDAVAAGVDRAVARGTVVPGDAHPRSLRLSRLATAGVRMLNGFLVLLLAFEFRGQEAGALDFGALIAAAGIGFGLASFISPWLERHLREEPMVVAALAIEAAAAFIAGQFFGLPAAAALAGAAGLAWGTAKFAFDGLLQQVVRPEDRGVAFTRSETLFQLAWVVGAIFPVTIAIDAEIGLAIAGVVALTAQTLFVSGLLVGVERS